MNFKPNEAIKLLEIKIDKYRPFYYAGASGDFNPIHIDNDFAKSVGLGGIILQGLCTMAYVYRAVMRDKDPSLMKSLKVRFRDVVKPLDELTIIGKSLHKKENLTTVELSAENQDGKQIITNSVAVIEN